MKDRVKIFGVEIDNLTLDEIGEKTKTLVKTSNKNCNLNSMHAVENILMLYFNFQPHCFSLFFQELLQISQFQLVICHLGNKNHIEKTVHDILIDV